MEKRHRMQKMNGIGSINWWGFSPAIDFQSYLPLKDADKTDVDDFSGNDSAARLSYRFLYPSKRIMELSYQGTFVPRNLHSLELSSPRVKFT